MLTASQSRMARAALGLGVRDLASLAEVSPNTIARLERGETLQERTLDFIQGALEAAGVEILDRGTTSPSGGEGVRLSSRGPQSQYAHLFNLIGSIPDLNFQGRDAYIALLDAMDGYLRIVEKQGREPDTWEAIDLNQVLNALNRGQLHLAYASLRHAITPPDNQSPDYPISRSAAKSVAGLDAQYFDKCSRQLRDRGPAFAD